eukprot:RCo036505
MLAPEEVRQKFSVEEIIRQAARSDEPFTKHLASKVIEICCLLDQPQSEAAFELFCSTVALLRWFTEDCPAGEILELANPAVWGTDRKWLAHARTAIRGVLASEHCLPAKFRGVALALFELLMVMFGQSWTCEDDKEGKFVQLVVSSCQIELDCILDSVMRDMDPDVPSKTPPGQPSSSSAQGITPTEAEAATKDTLDVSGCAPEDRLPLLVPACAVLQLCVRALTEDEENASGSPSWVGLEPLSLQRIHDTLMQAYSTLLQYFTFRKGVVTTDVDVSCVGVLDLLMSEFDSSVFAEEAETLREMLQASGYLTS